MPPRIEWSVYVDVFSSFLRLAFPLVLVQSISSLTNPITLAFCGILGSEKLAAASLALSIFNLTVLTCAMGIRWGCAPLFAQSYGSKKRSKVGVHLQKGLYCAVIFSIIGWCISINSANILILTGQSPQLAVLAEQYLMILIPGGLFSIVYRVLLAYTDAVRVVWPTFIATVLASIICAAMQYVFIYHTSFGFHGSAIALSTFYLLQSLFQYFIILAKRLLIDVCEGWSLKALTGWLDFYRVMMPSVVQTMFFLFGTEIGNFLAGILGTEHLAAQSVLIQINRIANMVAIGAGAASVSMIGRYLGANDPIQAKRVYTLNALFLCNIGLLMGIIIYAMKNFFPHLFSLDATSTQIFYDVLPLLCVYNGFFIASYSSIAGLRACNFHLYCVIINIFSYYLISIPLGVSLAFVAGYGLRGIWIGFVTAVITFCVTTWIFMSRVKWSDKASNIADHHNRDTDFESTVEKNLTAKDDNERVKLLDGRSLKKSHRKEKLGFWQTVKTKLCFLFILIASLLLSIIIRLVLPPIIPHNGTLNGTDFVLAFE